MKKFGFHKVDREPELIPSTYTSPKKKIRSNSVIVREKKTRYNPIKRKK